MKKKTDLSKVLVQNSTYARHALKRRLIEENLIPYECQVCKNDGGWNNQKLSLHLDHINGVFNDNRLCNLRFLCPNCHSQTDSYAGKNSIRKERIKSASSDYRYVKRKQDAIVWESIKNDPTINFNERGWVGEVAKRLSISPQKVSRWILRVDAAFYNSKYNPDTHRSVAQLAEQRPPKSKVGSSSLSGSAKFLE